MSSTFIEHSPEADGDKSLILIMDGEGNVTADPAHFEKLISNQKLPDMGIKIVRLDSSQTESGNDGDSENKQELKLTVEEIYPENLPLNSGDPSINIMNSPLEILPGPSNENISHDIVDPFSQMDPEQLQRLERALASEQAKQILGENVAAMLDMLNVDESPAAFLQNSIKNDHCYTNLLPSSDPNGPSFFVNDSRTINNGETSKGKGKARAGTPIKGRKIMSSGTIIPGGNFVKSTVSRKGPIVKQLHSKQTSIMDYGTPIGVTSLKPIEEVDDAYEEDIDVEDSEGSVGVDDDNLSDEDYSNRSTRTKKRPRKSRKKLVVRKPGRSMGRQVMKPSTRLGKRSFITPDMRVRNEQLNDAMSKVVQSMEFVPKEDDDKLKRGMKKVKPFTVKNDKEDTMSDREKGTKELPKALEEISTQGKSHPAKYPKRENRKPPAHLAEAFGPALFSTPDIIRRISTGDDLPQTPPEKKNFTVGVHSNSKVIQATTPSTPTKTEVIMKDSLGQFKSKQTPVKELTKGVKPSKIENENVCNITSTYVEGVESREEKVAIQKLSSEVSGEDIGPVNKKANIEIQKLIEKHQVKSTLYEEDEDYSDENIDENYYLDPTQMDQSLLEGFAQTASKSEDQLLQEAILLQEQLIESNKGIVLSESSGLDASSVEMPFGTETIEDIQNEITSAILVARQDNQTEPKQTFQYDESQIKTVSQADSVAANIADGVEDRSLGNQVAVDESDLVVDENRPEDRRRNSTRRRRSDEVSDLDSDLDDALSEASWNSEDDPDRLWCICRKPHNNRFMICCDVCEEWFHGKCVGITKTIGKQMEQDGLEWSCPNCTKKKKVEEHDRESEKIKLLKEKMAQSIKEQQLKIKESQKLKAQAVGGKDKAVKSPKPGNLKQTKISDFSHPVGHSSEDETVGRKCIMCKGPVRENSIYCSDDCIRKHSQHAISQLMSDKKALSESSGNDQGENSKLVQKIRKEESRIVVMDSNSKKFLVGQNAPTAANLTTWLKENPSYHVVYKKSDKPGKILLTSRKVVKIQSKPGETQRVFVQAQKVLDGMKSTQLKLAVSPNSKQINILQPAGYSAPGKKIYQIINSTGPGGKPTAFVVKPKQTEVIEALPLPLKNIPPKGVAVKVKESTSPKVTPVNREPIGPKLDKDKIQKKRKEKTQRTITVMSGKDVKLQKQDDSKEKEKDKKDTDQQIRESVKKTLSETLKARVQECKDMEYNEEHIDSLAMKIEEKLYKHFENKVDTKYKSKYRSLVFNIKDPKNETLYKKIVDNSISPKELVKLSPEELASQELARWREKENQHQLEMIKKTELELMTKGNTYIMKSHKGEQVIESDQSEKVAAYAAEIDPNTPAQELVSALNSVTSTTQDVIDDADKKGDSETSLMKMKKKEKERRRSRDRKHDRRDKDRRRSSSRSSRSRSHRSKDKKRSRSKDRDKDKEKEKDRDKDKSKSRHRDKKSEKKKEKSSKDGRDSVEEKSDEKYDKNEISTSEDTDDKLLRKSVEEDDADREPSSTVIIKTPDIEVEEPEPIQLWKGSIVMADVAKFNGFATEISGNCIGLSYDIGDKVDVVGRIPFATVWDYIARMKKMGTKDILVIKIMPVSDDEKVSYTTLYNYLSKRSRIGVIGKTSDTVKDFYLYPLASHSPLPAVLLPLDQQGFDGERENIILGIIVRNKHRSRHLGIAASDHLSKITKKSTSIDDENLLMPESIPDRSYTPPLPEKEQEGNKKERLKRKIRVRMDYKEASAHNEEEEELDDEDDSPYSPGDSDDDLPPLPKIAKTSGSNISNISKLLSPSLTTPVDSNLQDPSEIQRKIDEMNRAIEEQTQQIQSLTSTVPKLAAGVLPTLPLLANVTSAILTPSLSPSSSLPAANSVAQTSGSNTSVQSPLPASEKLPLISSDNEESNGPSRSFTPPLKVEENIPFLREEVTSKISLPSNLQEILNSIQKKPGDPESLTVDDAMKINNSNIDVALNVLNQTKSLLGNFPSGADKDGKPIESQAILSRLTDEELLMKAQEMEMEVSGDSSAYSASCPPQPLPPGIQDIPMLPPNGAYSNPPPPPFFANPLLSSAPIVESGFVKAMADSDEKKPEKRMKLDPKSVFESEGVPDFVKAPGSNWEDKKGQKTKNYKIDIKLAMNTLERKTVDMDHFDIESISKISSLRDDRPSGSGGIEQSNSAVVDEGKFDVDERIPTDDKYRGGGYDRDRRRSDDREVKRDWKYDGRRHWEDGRRHKDDYRRHGRRDRPKFRKDRFDDKRSRHLQKEWDGSIKNFEGQRWRNQDIRRDDMRRSRKRADSSTN
ncbi:hypothetical protein RUM44_002539 [Polyplax serrata]|uniref:Death-inducer obliterator 1 n=1 Tax=Polyplax serrata TaxID=468196 RepID=A0ABR1AF25_POLSC